MAYPEVNSQYPIRETQVERALAKCLDCWINFETYPLFKNGFAKALQAPTQLQLYASMMREPAGLARGTAD